MKQKTLQKVPRYDIQIFISHENIYEIDSIKNDYILD